VRARTTAAVTGAIVAVAALTGCGLQPGAVAEVEGTTITESDIDAVVDELGPFLQRSSRDAVLTALVQSEAGALLAERHDIEVADERAIEFLDSLAALSGGEPPAWSAGSITIARMQLIGQELQALPDPQAASDEFYALLADLDITVSPRYGEYDPSTGEVVALSPAWIVVPGATE
jgi:hypothetical protein